MKEQKTCHPSGDFGVFWVLSSYKHVTPTGFVWFYYLLSYRQYAPDGANLQSNGPHPQPLSLKERGARIEIVLFEKTP